MIRRLCLAAAFLLTIVSPVIASGPDGPYWEIDPTFAPVFGGGPSQAPTAFARQADGKVLVAGSFESVNGASFSGAPVLLRLLADGSVDNSFAAETNGTTITKLIVQADGKIVAFGAFASDPWFQVGIGNFLGARRFESSGARDFTFNAIIASEILHNPTTDALGRLYYSAEGGTPGQLPVSTGIGQAPLYPNAGGGELFRRPSDAGAFTAHFALDRYYSTGPGLGGKRHWFTGIYPQGNGYILARLLRSYPEEDSLIRLLPDGTQDSSFTYPWIADIRDVVALPDGSVLVVRNEANRLRVERWKADNTLDANFSYNESYAGSSVPLLQDLNIVALVDYLLRSMPSDQAGGFRVTVGAGELSMVGAGPVHGVYLADLGQGLRLYVRSAGDEPGFAAAPLAFAPQTLPEKPPFLQPVLAQGYPLTLEADTDGFAPFEYQWLKNGNPIAGAALKTLAFGSDGVQPGEAGEYAVTVTNLFGTHTSPAFVLTVHSTYAVPQIVTPPANQTVVSGQTATFSVTATGSLPLSYTWYRNGVAMINPTGDPWGPVLTIPNVGSDMAGTYRVAVSAYASGISFGPDLQAAATLTVWSVPPSFAWQAYLTRYPDIAAVIGNTAEAAWNHYLNHGIAENRTDGDFDVRAYLAQYPALAAQFGTDLQAAASHWYTVGRAQGLRIPTGFDVVGYLARHLDLYALFANDKYGAWLHYFNYGLNEGRDFDANFIVDEYLELNPDVKAAFGTNRQAAVMHWFQYGHPIEDRMGRVPIGFNVDNYLARYPDLNAVFGGITPRAVRNVMAWHQYLAYGTLESRSDGDFEANAYLASNPDLAAVYGTDVRGAALHWFFYGRREGRRIPTQFDVQFYRTRYPDIVVIFGDDLYGSWLHYLDWGINEGRVFDELFRPDDYIALNPDLAPLIGNDRELAVLHWLHFGKAAGRPGRY